MNTRISKIAVLMLLGLPADSLAGAERMSSGQGLTARSGLQLASHLEAYEIRGVVLDETPNISDEAFEKIEEILRGTLQDHKRPRIPQDELRKRCWTLYLGLPQSEEQIRRALQHGQWNGRPLSDKDRAELSRMYEKATNDLARLLSRLEKADEKERNRFLALLDYREALLGVLGRKPASNAHVVLRAGGHEYRTRTDRHGKFKFVGFPAGQYEIYAEAPAPVPAGGKSWGRMVFDFVPGQEVLLRISAYAITVKGSVVTADGAPVVGAKIVGEPAFAWDVLYGTPSQPVRAPRRKKAYRLVTVTAADGSYELSGFPPPALATISRYLAGGAITALKDLAGQRDLLTDLFVEIRAEAPGYIQPEALRVPMVTEALRDAARRWWRLKIRATSDLSDEEKAEYKFREKGDLFPSQRNTIYGVDIVMERVSRPEGEGKAGTGPRSPAAGVAGAR